MNLQHNTILITGGSSGIGLELAKVLIAKNNTVLICGRSKDRLEKAKRQLPTLHTFQCDLAKSADRERLYNWVVDNHPSCNILINNAAVVSRTDFRADDQMIEKAEQEVQTNFIAPVALCKLFLRLLESNERPAIINVTTGLVYAPKAEYPIYNATKAALHSFTKVLRHQLRGGSLQVVEVLMTVVDTPWHNGQPPKMAITVDSAVQEMIVKLEKGQEEIRIGKVRLLYLLARIAPEFAFKKMNSL